MNDLLPANPTDKQVERANAIIEYLNGAIDKLPTGGEDGILGILESIIGATDPTQLDRAWDSAGFGQMIGYRITVSNPRKLKSDFANTIPFYLLCDVVIKATGEIKTATTGSYAIMSQIIVAADKGMLPLDFVPFEAEEPTENGFYPQHLKVWRPGMPDEPAPRAPRAERRAPASGGRTAEQRFADRIKADVAADKAKATFDVPETPEF